jgi:anaphase-promoting complex subunit 1
MAHDHHPKVLVLGPARHSASQSFGPAASKGKGKAKAAQVDDELDDLDLGLGEDVNSIYEAIQDAFKEIHTSKNNPIYTYSTAPSTSSASASFSSWSGSSRSSVGEEAQEIELAWNSDTVIASVGGVQTQRWTMEFEGQDIQWACWGWLEQPGGLGDGVRSTGRDIYATSHSLLSPNSQLHPSKAKPGEFKPYIPNHNTLRPTFGPFADSMNGRTKIEAPSRVRAVFIFLRSIARIFLENGRDYTIHLPFLVRKAWSLHPVGVLVQRVLSKEEETELSHSMAEDGKDNDVLPTIYSLSDPFSEFRVVCAASTITGGMTPQEPASVPFSATSSGPPPTIQPTDKIVWTSDGTEPHEQLFVTVDVRGKYFRIWRYARVIPEDDEETGQSQSRSDSQGSSQPNLPSVQRGSAPSSGPNTQTTQSTGLSQPTIVPLPSAPVLKRSHSRVVSGSIADLPLPDSGYLLEDTQPTLNTQASATTLHTQGHERADSGTRNELSATLDRMALGTQSAYGHTHEGMGVGSAGEGILGEGLGGARMKPAYWAHELFSDVLGEEE